MRWHEIKCWKSSLLMTDASNALVRAVLLVTATLSLASYTTRVGGANRAGSVGRPNACNAGCILSTSS